MQYETKFKINDVVKIKGKRICFQITAILIDGYENRYSGKNKEHYVAEDDLVHVGSIIPTSEFDRLKV